MAFKQGHKQMEGQSLPAAEPRSCNTVKLARIENAKYTWPSSAAPFKHEWPLNAKGSACGVKQHAVAARQSRHAEQELSCAAMRSGSFIEAAP